MTSARLRDALQQGRIDVALLMRSEGQSPHESFEWRFIAHDPYDTALVPADGLGTSTTAVGVRELGELTCVVLSRDEDPGYHDEVVALLRKAGIASALLPLQHGPRALWRYVASGARWTLAPRSMRAAPPANLVALPLEGISLGASLNVAVRVGETDPHVRALAAAF
jgi:DNA-binding transcriptional LysR family regulator